MVALPTTTKVSNPDKVARNQMRCENGTVTPVGAPLLIQTSANAPTNMESGYANVWANSGGLQVSLDGGTTNQSVGGPIVVRAEYLATSVDNSLFIADRAYRLLGVRAVNTVIASSGPTTLDIKKCTGTQAPASGTTMLTATIDLTTTANTVITPTLSATPANLLLAAGDRIALDYTGTMTAVVGSVEVLLTAA